MSPTTTEHSISDGNVNYYTDFSKQAAICCNDPEVIEGNDSAEIDSDGQRQHC
jgi:hypothetical protein